LTRLEAATSRLEDIAITIDGPSPPTNGVPDANTGTATPSIYAIAPETAAPPPEPLPKSVEAFNQIIQEDVDTFRAAAEKIGGLVEEQVCEILQPGYPTWFLISPRQKQSKKHSRPNGHTCL
jgi:adenylyl cyclase-associated protein